MPVEETMWDVEVPRDVDSYDTERFRAALAESVQERLSPGKQLLRVVSWCAEGVALFWPKSGHIAVAYEVALNV